MAALPDPQPKAAGRLTTRLCRSQYQSALVASRSTMDCAAPLRLSGLIRDEAICDGVEVLFCFKAMTSVIEEERNWAALTARPSDGFLH